MSGHAKVERNLLVFAAWATSGFSALAFFLEGLARDSYLLSLAGVALVVVTFAIHIVINAVSDCGFSAGEATLGIGAFGVLALVFIAAWLDGGLTAVDYWSGLTLFGVLVCGFLLYLSTRHGLRGAFSRFHFKPAESGNEPR
ncbi:hypothetical protein JET14_22105 (plasmid) [Martelella lutilitoris]|uniref:Uncharacterized protein n=1 Tax=Martelella lutilitoris TaxID=2583532 RepID=A0A7T7HPT8_9HYPH|nr:hypothetical protein [Martelella lutilitoris]QQM33145.1 hypothetical protein JET14_22105 [Martelella lutilitoris]QRX65296.1 hypothetical protein JS578_13700 [Dysgonomonadaceae bacterium zrk40]